MQCGGFESYFSLNFKDLKLRMIHFTILINSEKIRIVTGTISVLYMYNVHVPVHVTVTIPVLYMVPVPYLPFKSLLKLF
jgi:hypothetical protein